MKLAVSQRLVYEKYRERALRLVIVSVALLTLTSCTSPVRRVPTISASPASANTAPTPANTPTLVVAISPTDVPTATEKPPSPTVVLPTSTIAPPTTTAALARPIVASAVGLGQRAKTADCQARGPLPDPACSPGAIFPDATTAQICVPGYSSSVRDVTQAEKNQIYAEYGIKSHTAGEYEADHLISLELGGSNDVANLWPEAASPKPGFHEKDKVENYLHDQVCAGKVDLATAQHEIASDWLAVYDSMSGSSAVAVIATSTSVAPASAPSTPTTAPVSGHTYYLSAYRTAHEFYCDDDPAWHKLSPNYLVHLNSLAEVQAQFPTYTLHRPC